LLQRGQITPACFPHQLLQLPTLLDRLLDL
jgi:hypothetical protein